MGQFGSGGVEAFRLERPAESAEKDERVEPGALGRGRGRFQGSGRRSGLQVHRPVGKREDVLRRSVSCHGFKSLALFGHFFHHLIAGIDLGTLGELGAASQMEGDIARRCKLFYKTIRTFQNHFMEIERCPKPVISAARAQ